MKFFPVLIALLFFAVLPARADEFEKELIRQINVERTQRQIPPLQTDDYLMEVARVWAKNIAGKDKLIHRANMGLVMEKAGYSGLNENLYYMTFPLTPERVVEGWLNSPGHKKNMLAPDMALVGVGYAIAANGGKYIVFNAAVKAVPKALPTNPGQQNALNFPGRYELK